MVNGPWMELLDFSWLSGLGLRAMYFVIGQNGINLSCALE